MNGQSHRQHAMAFGLFHANIAGRNDIDFQSDRGRPPRNLLRNLLTPPTAAMSEPDDVPGDTARTR